MSFWSTSDNDDATNTGTSFETTTGNENIPDNTTCTAMLDEIKWALTRDDSSAEFISGRWRIIKPEVYANRVVFAKYFVTDDDPNVKADKMPAKRDKAKRMLAAIDANAGGKLAKLTTKPTDVQLASALLGKSMNIKVMEYSFPDRNDASKQITGNFIAAVSAKGAVSEPEKPVAKPANRPSSAPAVDDDDMSDVPF